MVMLPSSDRTSAPQLATVATIPYCIPILSPNVSCHLSTGLVLQYPSGPCRLLRLRPLVYSF